MAAKQLYIVHHAIETRENRDSTQRWLPSDQPQDLSAIPAERLALAVERGLISPAPVAKEEPPKK